VLIAGRYQETQLVQVSPHLAGAYWRTQVKTYESVTDQVSSIVPTCMTYLPYPYCQTLCLAQRLRWYWSRRRYTRMWSIFRYTRSHFMCQFNPLCWAAKREIHFQGRWYEHHESEIDALPILIKEIEPSGNRISIIVLQMEACTQVPGGTKQAGWPPRALSEAPDGFHRIEILECREYSGESGTIVHGDTFLVVGWQNVIYIFRPDEVKSVQIRAHSSCCRKWLIRAFVDNIGCSSTHYGKYNC
jgi:hypothetical protein